MSYNSVIDAIGKRFSPKKDATTNVDETQNVNQDEYYDDTFYHMPEDEEYDNSFYQPNESPKENVIPKEETKNKKFIPEDSTINSNVTNNSINYDSSLNSNNEGKLSNQEYNSAKGIMYRLFEKYQKLCEEKNLTPINDYSYYSIKRNDANHSYDQKFTELQNAITLAKNIEPPKEELKESQKSYDPNKSTTSQKGRKKSANK